jgi:hypothetical protein
MGVGRGNADRGPDMRITPERELAGMARYLARKVIKAQLRRANIHLLDVEPSDITRAADDLLRTNGPELIERAKLWLDTH